MIITDTPSLEDITESIRLKILQSPHISPLIGSDIGTDALLSKPSTLFADGWVFPGEGDELSPYRDPTSTGTTALTYGMRSPWGGPNLHNTQDFRQLVFVIWSDPTRDANNNALPLNRDAENRCDRVAKQLKAEFNDVQNRDHWWPNNVYIASCLLFADLVMQDVFNADGLIRGELRFQLAIG